MLGPLGLPGFVLTDSYKLSHATLYPDSQKMVAYGEFRSSFNNDSEDERIVFYGIRYFIDTYLSRQWTEEDVQKSDHFFSTHNAGSTQFPFPKELFLKFVRENNGYFPIKVQALPEGSVIYPHIPAYQITAEAPYASLVTYMETLLTMVWYPSTVATLSRRCRSIIERAFSLSVDDDQSFLLESRLHDFGFRACTSVEQAILGGSAHLINFEGSDTLAACYYAQYQWNGGRPLASSIPATEHSVMTAHLCEKDAILKLIENYGSGVFACVMDSYDYAHALASLLPEVAPHKLEKGGFLVLRPDSGDPIETVLMALRAAEKVFGVYVNQKGFKVIKGCGVIQGDGIGIESLKLILDAVLAAGFSAQNITFGMGGNLLQKLNRDTMSFATKLAFRLDTNGDAHFIAKTPKSDSKKTSLPGQFCVIPDSATNLPHVYLKGKVGEEKDLLKVVYDMGKPLAAPFDDFDTIRKRTKSQWTSFPKSHSGITPDLQNQIDIIKASRA
ncbi:hypothetical protein DSO57_1021004 [Entomophthora muscae]|uniref:Uncharacterized protein n=1 Tax=Entomophthora muscae TaxID=34485 RepID=A0ACC2RI95_9FUNG|nr:hypothetical protein DSO57_1021004 [Entomophthora muscae]